MPITVKEIMEKYPTEFNLNQISQNLYDTTIIPAIDDGNDYTITDVEKPKHTQTNNGHKYTYKVGQYTVVIDNYLNTFDVEVKWYDNGIPQSITYDSDGTPLL